jgi:EF hand
MPMPAVHHALLFCALFALMPAASAQTGVSSSNAPQPAAAPGTTPRGTGDYLSRIDADRDGKVSLAEYQDWLSYAFDGMDRNRDGVLSPEEQPGGRGKALTRDAHRARLAERFRRQDVDRSGFLDAKELAAPPQGK